MMVFDNNVVSETVLQTIIVIYMVIILIFNIEKILYWAVGFYK